MLSCSMRTLVADIKFGDGSRMLKSWLCMGALTCSQYIVRAYPDYSTRELSIKP